MLVEVSQTSRQYRIAVSNATGTPELLSDFSYLVGIERGTVVFDLTHMGAPLTQEKREDYYPGGFGYQPTQQLIEVVSSIGSAPERLGEDHRLLAVLPEYDSSVGRFLADMRLKETLEEMGVEISFAGPATRELGVDDPTRRNLIALTNVKVSSAGPDFRIIRQVRDRIEGVFAEALRHDETLANLLTQIVSEAVDNLIAYGRGGLIGGLYYPRIGEVEITLINRYGAFGGSTACEQLEALIEACESGRARCRGGNGLRELSTLTATCFGTLLIRNGNAKLSLPPDGSVTGITDETGIDHPGASVTVLLQLIPGSTQVRNTTMQLYEAAVSASLERYMNARQQSVNHGRR